MDAKKPTILLIVILASVVCCCAVLAAAAVFIARMGMTAAIDLRNLDVAAVSAEKTHSSTFEVSSPATLIVEMDLGAVDIEGRDQDQVTVDAEITVYGTDKAAAQAWLDQVTFDVAQEGSTVTITSRVPKRPQQIGRSPEIKVRVVVPTETEVKLRTGVGDIDLANTVGDVQITADVGRVHVVDVSVSNTLDIQTDVAEINFEGALSEGSRYTFASDIGAIRLALPADSAFAIDAASNLGTVTIDFDVVGESNRDLVSKSVKGVVNGGAGTPVIIRSDVGPIGVRQQ